MVTDSGSGFRIAGMGIWDDILGFRVYSREFRVKGLGRRDHGVGWKVQVGVLGSGKECRF